MIDRRPSSTWPVRAALGVVPRTWRGSVAQDLDDEAGTSVLAPWWCALEAVGIGLLLHWQFTRGAIMSELRYTVRSMARAPAFALGAIATFALGIGVNVAVFSAVDRMLFRPLPYADPSSLVVMGEFKVGASQPYGTVSAQTVVEVRKLDTVVDVTTTDWNSDTYRQHVSDEGARYFEFVPMPVHDDVGARRTPGDRARLLERRRHRGPASRDDQRRSLASGIRRAHGRRRSGAVRAQGVRDRANRRRPAARLHAAAGGAREPELERHFADG